MIFDKTNMFSDAQAITASAASTNVVDLGPRAIARDIGKGKGVPILIQAVETFDTAAEDGTLTVAYQVDSTETFTPDKAITIGTFAEADLVAGWQFPFTVIPNGLNLQYMRLFYTVGGAGSFTAGKITAGVVAGVQTA